MTSPLVSIITPAYKAAGYIDHTIRSVQKQTYGTWELLIVDDGSPDNTAEVVLRYCALDSRIKLIRQKNAGPAMARQAALDAANGKFIAFLDSDDCWLPEKLALQLDFMEKTAASFTYTSFRRVDSSGQIVGHRVRIPGSLTYRQLLGNTAIATSTVVIDREKTGAFRMTRTFYDDFVLWLGLLKRGHTAYALDIDLMRYRVVSQSVSRNKFRSMRMVWKTYREIENLGWLVSAISFISYAFHAWRKYKKF